MNKNTPTHPELVETLKIKKKSQIDEEQLIFFVGIPGSSWARVSTILGWSPVMNLNRSDEREEREYYITQNTSWPGLVNHRGSFFGSKMEFGENWEYPIERGLTKEDIMKDIHDAFEIWDDKNYLIKSHSIAQSLDWWIEQFPNSKFIFVIRDYEASMKWWFNGGGFDIKFPCYEWYVDEERMKHKAKLQDWAIREFIDKNDITTYGITSGFIKNELQMEFDDHSDIEKHYRGINHMPPDKSKGIPVYDVQIGFYGFEDIFW